MNFVEPIRNLNRINKIKDNLKKKENPRDFTLFVLGLNTGMRVSDMVALRAGDVKDSKGDIRTFLSIKEQKTKRNRKIPLNSGVREALQYYFDKSGIWESDKYLFVSEKRKGNRPLTRCAVWQLINKWCQDVGITGKIGTHSLRKSLGYHLRKSGTPIEVISARLGHKSIRTTSQYIGIDDDELEKNANGFVL